MASCTGPYCSAEKILQDEDKLINLLQDRSVNMSEQQVFKLYFHCFRPNFDTEEHEDTQKKIGHSRNG